MSLSGNLKTMDLAELLQWITLGRKTGSLTFVRNKTKNYIFFKDGKIISSKSNEPTKQIGHYLLFQGKITEVQLKRALEIQQRSRMNLAKILVLEGYITKEEAGAALVGRTEEVIYDLFLWEEGYFHFTANGFSLDDLILIDLDINALLFEGVRRKDEWVRIREIFPSNNVVLAIRPGADLKQALKPLQKKLLFLVSQRKMISEIILEVHGSDFQVSFELFQMCESGILEVREIREEPPQPDDPAVACSRARELIQARRYPEAIAVLQETQRLHPQNAAADELMEIAEKALCQELYGKMPPDKVPKFIVPESALTRFSLSYQEGFVASRINGACDVRSIIMLSPLRELDILQILDKLLKLDLIALS